MILSAIATLEDILGRMATHQHKKTSLLRRLGAWDGSPATARPPGPGESL